MENEDEIRFWNRRGGTQWSANQGVFDTLFSRVSARLLTLAAVKSGEKVLDIGCGNSDTTLALANACGQGGSVLGVDVSAPLLDAARSRLASLGVTQVELRQADAQTTQLHYTADVITSRFGVMFFADPVAAFQNLRSQSQVNARLAFSAWGELEDNPWFAWPFEAASSRLGDVPVRDPRKPGPTAFGDPDYINTVLSQAGWQQISVRSEQISLLVEGDALHTAQLASVLGPVSRVYKTYPPTDEDRKVIVEQLATRFQPHTGGTTTEVPARIHFVTAVA